MLDKVADVPATAVEREHRVTPRERFFDLVLVFALTQVAARGARAESRSVLASS